MSSNKANKPTEAELEVLQILWDKGPSTVRSVNEVLGKKRNVGYTTTLKIMQIMTEKGLVKRDEEGRTHIYEAVPEKETTQGILLERFLSNAFSGSTHKLVMQALGNHKTSEEELRQIKELISELEKKQKDELSE
jgi:predicted transcriptional regulator